MTGQTAQATRYEHITHREDLDAAMLEDLRSLHASHDSDEYDNEADQAALWRVAASWLADYREQQRMLGYGR